MYSHRNWHVWSGLHITASKVKISNNVQCNNNDTKTLFQATEPIDINIQIQHFKICQNCFTDFHRDKIYTVVK